MLYYLSSACHLKWLESPTLYNIKTDDLYELDPKGFDFLKKCASGGGICDDQEFISYCIEEEILTTSPDPKERVPIRQSPIPSLRYLELLLTDRCNLKCRHCYIGASRGEEIDLERLLQILREFDQMQGLRLLISGGEPLLYREFTPFNRQLPEFGFRKILFSNGILLTDKVLKGLNVDEIQISIDGLEKGHDAIRGKGTYQKALEAVKLAIHEGFHVSIATMVHTENLDEFDGMDRLFRELGIKEWTVDVPCNNGNLKDNPKFSLPPERAGQYLRYGFNEGLHGGGKGYACGLHLMSILPDGRAAKCAFYADTPAGNIDEGLETCWKRIKPIKLSSLKCDCRFLHQCRGGCRYRAGLLGDPHGKDLYRCVAMLS